MSQGIQKLWLLILLQVYCLGRWCWGWNCHNQVGTKDYPHSSLCFLRLALGFVADVCLFVVLEVDLRFCVEVEVDLRFASGLGVVSGSTVKSGVISGSITCSEVVSGSTVGSKAAWLLGSGVSDSGVSISDEFSSCRCVVDRAEDLRPVVVLEDDLRFALGVKVVSGSAVEFGVVSGCVTCSELVSGSTTNSGVVWLSGSGVSTTGIWATDDFDSWRCVVNFLEDLLLAVDLEEDLRFDEGD